jgi:hypothetical protein
MAQHDYNIANGTGAAVRSDLNNALAAIVSQNSGATEPTTTYAYMPWADTTTGLYKIRNAANNGWITLRELDGTLTIEAGTVSAPGLAFASDLNTGIYSPSADQLAIATNGVERVEWGTTEVVFNDGGTNYDFRIEGDTVDSLFFVDASTDRVGLGTSSPQAVLTTQAGSSLSTTWNTFTGDGIYFSALNATVANQAYGPGISWSRNGSNTTRAAAISSVQEGADADLVGLAFFTHGSTDNTQPIVERMRIDETGSVGIGTTSPGVALHVDGDIRCDGVYGETDTNTSIQFPGSDVITFNEGGSEAARIDSSGRLLVGTSSARANFDSNQTAALQIEGSTLGTANLSVTRSDSGGAITLCGVRGGVGGNTVVNNGQALGFVIFEGSDGTKPVRAATIAAEVDGTPGANDMPCRLVFSTTADGASSPTERMRITQSGQVIIGKQTLEFSVPGMYLAGEGLAALTASNQDVLALNRLSSDGTLINFYQATTSEGTISVSGTTVSYNGAHLSRWSQLPGGSERKEILRGTVLSNIDEMCGWGEEENEQLNRMKVSDVEGDPNVAGVFQAWDDDDDTYTDDFYCAMTGDFIIRIAEGVTVQRGDLLMSAGDGTAKPQDDDIIRSKTVAKVTSTHVTCTYEDGSYCVPCVLMAC